MGIELFFLFFEDPKLAVRHVWSRRPVGLGVLAFGIAGAGLLFSQGLFRPLPSVYWLPWAVGFWWGWELVWGLLLACVSHFLAESWGGRGSGICLFILFGLSQLVWALAVPLALILKALGLGVGGWLSMLALLGAASLWFKIRSVRDHYSLPGHKAAAILLIPYLLAGVAAAAGAVVGVWSLASVFSGWLS